MEVALAAAGPPPFPCRPRVVSLAAPVCPAWSCGALVATDAAALVAFGPLFARALALLDLDAAWGLLSAAAAAYPSRRCGRRALRPGAAAAPSPRASFAPKLGRDGDALTRDLARCLRVLRILERALRTWPEGAGVLPWPVCQDLRAASRLAAALGRPLWRDALAAVTARRSSLETAVGLLGDAYRSEVAARRRSRAESWCRFVQADMLAGGRRTLRWVREPASQAPSSPRPHA